ncbi:hypothetical protein C1I64_13505 [Rathayibacter festucae DSM 15932]|uniref:Uncharacterized protein n=1 Tax=Rathayibacter festucae DSM 15932 TaxID=1328866 RepID=A0A3T0T2W2_9MICO|nr:hypothetical protein C1I64_13505 [Rathayibacter festucae DSM 15932]
MSRLALGDDESSADVGDPRPRLLTIVAFVGLEMVALPCYVHRSDVDVDIRAVETPIERRGTSTTGTRRYP